jgi:hypothetical protein
MPPARSGPTDVHSAEAFQRLLNQDGATHETLVALRADAQVWWDILERYPHAAAWVAANRHLPPDLIEHLAMHPSPQVRAALATSSHVPEALMMQLAHDRSELIRLRVVCNAHTTRDVLAALTADPCHVVSAHARARLVHDQGGLPVPATYIEDLNVLDILH